MVFPNDILYHICIKVYNIYTCMYLCVIVCLKICVRIYASIFISIHIYYYIQLISSISIYRNINEL